MSIEALLRKLRHKPEYMSLILNAPDSIINDFKESGFHSEFVADEYDFTILFVENKSLVEKTFQPTLEKIKYDSVFWLAYPKGRSKIKTDINRDILWELLKPTGFRPVSQVSINDTWSAMRFRPTEKVKPR